MLEARNLRAGYGAAPAVWDVSLDIAEGELVVVVGPNGAGKTTLINTLAGLHRLESGRLGFLGKDISSLPAHRFCDQGIALVPEGRRLFPKLTVEENLLLGAFRPTARAEMNRNLDFCYEMFGRLKERRHQLAGSMSGGEQQMLALARALMSAPRILLVDEPSVGLAPILVSHTIDTIKTLQTKYHLTVLMAEQNFTQAIRIADRGYVIVHGKIAFEGKSSDELNNNDLIRKFYLGI
jgi:branched-chain amino acid transport system ATP-binding protein